MKLLFSLILFALPLAAQLDTADKVKAMLAGPTSSGTYTISPGTYNLEGLFVLKGRLSGAEGAPVAIVGAGQGETVLECPGVCYFEPNEHVTFRNLTIRGAINSRHLRHWRFEGVRFEDGGIGWPQKVLFKTTGAPRPFKNPVDVGAGPVDFEGCTFAPSLDGEDTALDFVAVQGVRIMRSIWERCNRGCLQAKGGSGILEPYEIGYNWVKNGGVRGLFVGGGANWEFFDPPIDRARAEFGAAWIHNNVIEGAPEGDGRQSACFFAASVAGPVRFEHNLCIAQRGWLLRLSDENQRPETSDGVRNVSMAWNVFVDWTPPQWPNTNVLSAATVPSVKDWSTISADNNLFNFASRKQFWGWPNADPLPTTGNLENQVVEISRDANGKPFVVGWPDYGPRPEPPVDESVEAVRVFVTLDGRLYLSREAAAATGKAFVELRLGPAQ